MVWAVEGKLTELFQEVEGYLYDERNRSVGSVDWQAVVDLMSSRRLFRCHLLTTTSLPLHHLVFRRTALSL